MNFQKPSLSPIADCFTYLFTDENLKLTTIAGYRTAMADQYQIKQCQYFHVCIPELNTMHTHFIMYFKIRYFFPYIPFTLHMFVQALGFANQIIIHCDVRC